MRHPPPLILRPRSVEPLVPFYVWWAIPLVATLIAVAWLSWRARERQVDPHDSVAARRRFIAAMETPPVGRRPARPADASSDAAAEAAKGPDTAPESGSGPSTSDPGREASA